MPKRQLLGQSTDASSGSPMTPATGSTPQTDISYHESMRTQQPAQASQCTSTDPQPTSSSPNNIDNILSAVFQSGESAVPKSNVCLLDGIPLGAAVPIKTKGKIWEDKYIDLSSLLQRQGEPLSLNIASASITLQQPAKHKAPLTIHQWTDAFLLFMAVYIEKFPDQAPHLLKYCYFIRDMHKMLGDGSWRLYDEEFRQLRESTVLPWQKPLEELRLKAAACSFQKRSPTQQLFRKPVKHVRYCFTFNNTGLCKRDPCPFIHSCQNCSGSHPKSKCRVTDRRFRQGAQSSKFTANSSQTKNSK